MKRLESGRRANVSASCDLLRLSDPDAGRQDLLKLSDPDTSQDLLKLINPDVWSGFAETNTDGLDHDLLCVVLNYYPTAPSYAISSVAGEDFEGLYCSLGHLGWRNKRVCEGNIVSAEVAMDNYFNHTEEWKIEWVTNKSRAQNCQKQDKRLVHKWKPPNPVILKININASFRLVSKKITIGMVLRNHEWKFLAGRCFESAATVLEGEAIATREALSLNLEYFKRFLYEAL
ncbi:hypothetical protein AgCh_012855 [Apium graveolens]